MNPDQTINRVIELLKEAIEAASLKNADFGFPSDRIEIKSVYGGDDHRGRVGDVVHPTDYIRNRTSNHHRTWIIAPLEHALQLLTINKDELARASEVLTKLDSVRDILGPSPRNQGRQ